MLWKYQVFRYKYRSHSSPHKPRQASLLLSFCTLALGERRALRRMASLKAAKPFGLMAQQPKEPSKASEGPPRASASKQSPKKAEQKPKEPKKKAKSAKQAAKN